MGLNIGVHINICNKKKHQKLNVKAKKLLTWLKVLYLNVYLCPHFPVGYRSVFLVGSFIPELFGPMSMFHKARTVTVIH